MEKNSESKKVFCLVAIIIVLIIAVFILYRREAKELESFSENFTAHLVDDDELVELLQGPAGEDGEDGVDGTDGEDGATGPRGPAGIDGENGIDGTNGIDGEDGAEGPQGPAGEDGINGVDGAVGLQGPAGEDGTDGVDGVSGTINLDTASDLTGLIKGNGSMIEVAVADVDYLTPGTVASSYLKLDGSNGPITGDLTISPTTNSTSTFLVEDEEGNPIFSVDTINGRLGIGTATPSSVFDLLGVARFGDGVTDYSEFEADGTLKMNGAATVWDDLRVQILTRTSARVSPTFTAGFGGNAELYTYLFDPDTDNNVYFEAQMPHSWASTKIYPHVHWSPTTTGTGNVRWILECSWTDYQQTFGTAFTYVLDSNIAEASQWKHVIADPGTGVTPTVNQNGVSSMLICRLYRDGGAAEDTYDDEASLVAFDIHYEIDTIGSRTMYSK